MSLDGGWIQHSTAGHAATGVLVQKLCFAVTVLHDHRGLNGESMPSHG